MEWIVSLLVSDREGWAVHQIAFKTDIGHTHHINQDAGGAWTWHADGRDPITLLVVADGVSAGRHSEHASRLAVDVLRDEIERKVTRGETNRETLLEALVSASRQANHQVAQRPHDTIQSADATTLVAVICSGTRAAGIWCGDSRVYRIADSRVIRLTRDHSWAEGVISQGLMTAEAAARDPRAHMITRWLGPPELDDPGLEYFSLDLSDGDVLLCCTDGLYMYFSSPDSGDDVLGKELAIHPDNLQAGVDRLVTLALQRGGRDNVTAAALRIAAG